MILSEETKQKEEKTIFKKIQKAVCFRQTVRMRIKKERSEARAMALSEEELEVVMECVMRKAMRLEEVGLADSKCYPLLMSAHHKLRKMRDEIGRAA